MTQSDVFPSIPPGLAPEEVVNRCLLTAAKFRVSDLFFECHENHVNIAVRHLGFVRVMTMLPADLGRRVIAHLKVMANMDLAEKRRPQDGRWVRELEDDTKLDFRISTIPTLYGEDLAIRVLIRKFGLLKIEQLGLIKRNLHQVFDVLNSPSGLILVTGPTGSGKTTTMYACMGHLNTGDKKINAIEDPIEYAIDGVRQSQINPLLEVDFPELLRAVLRQSPDIIMIGEIRDSITAETAVRAANSGHLVLATLHAPISAGAIQSMLSLGVHPHFLSGSLRAVIAQRLVRTLCPHCKGPLDMPVAPDMFVKIKRLLNPNEGEKLYGSDGCPECLHTGYAERTGIFEVLPISPAIRGMIMNREPTQTLRAQAIKEGLMEIRDAAMLKVAQGHTTVEEVLRVVPMEFLTTDD